MRLARDFPAWAALTVEYFGIYLGVAVGPASPGRSWDKPLAKYSRRVAHLLTQGPGLHAMIHAYHMLALSVWLKYPSTEDKNKVRRILNKDGSRERLRVRRILNKNGSRVRLRQLMGRLR